MTRGERDGPWRNTVTMDDHELSHAIHVLQYRLMSRPAYRKYRAPAKDEKK